MNMAVRAQAFDTDGTVLDWQGSIVAELAAFAPWQGQAFERPGFVNEWRRRTMKGIVGQQQPAFDTDDVHLCTAFVRCPEE
jgi:2-haloacid dehalogenase